MTARDCARDIHENSTPALGHGFTGAPGFVCAFAWIHSRNTDSRLLRTEPTEILNDPLLLRKAADLGRPLYQKHCAECHGAALQGNPERGVPNLAKNVWLYGNDPVGVEHTILYGIRSGHPKARNVMDMPALVRSGQITQEDARDVVEFLESLAGVPYDPRMARQGRDIYYNKGNCFDCHAGDAEGAIDYGAPGLTGPVWLYGGSRETLYQSILDGRHGICPAWIDVLTPLQIRALALYLVSEPRAVADGTPREVPAMRRPARASIAQPRPASRAPLR